jgi:uncharacterized membrane protein YfcA
MDVYLPLAKMALNAPLLALLGIFAGILSGLFGVGGGFILTPLLTMIGVPPSIAVGTLAAQLTGTSASGAVIQWQRGQIDLRMGGILLIGSLSGAAAGTGLFGWLRHLGYIDVTVNVGYALLLSIIGYFMLRDSWKMYCATRYDPQITVMPPRPPLGTNWPFRIFFPVSRLHISIFAPLTIGFFCGILTAILGIGGSFVLIPAMFYLLRVPATHLNGTALFQVAITTAVTAIFQALMNHNVDVVLGLILLIGSVLGVQFGNRLTTRIPPEKARLAFALLVLALAAHMVISLLITPRNMYALDVRLPT